MIKRDLKLLPVVKTKKSQPTMPRSSRSIAIVKVDKRIAIDAANNAPQPNNFLIRLCLLLYSQFAITGQANAAGVYQL